MQRPRSEGRRSNSNSQNQSSLVARSLQFGANAQDSQPRRPNTTPKPRIQRLLPSPGHNGAQERSASRQSMAQPPSTLTRLPDSPPRLSPIEDTDTSTEDSLPRSSDVISASSTVGATISHEGVDADAPHSLRDNLDTLEDGDNLSSTNNASASNSAELEREQSSDAKKHDPEEIEDESSDVAGPLLINIEANLDDDDDAYKHALANRKQLLSDEANRQRIRKELESYVSSLCSLTDEDGEHLVEYPKNYQQIVSLMTQKDVSEEESTSQEGKHTRQSWSRVLIEAGLSKQQAFGIIEDVDPEGKSSLAAKIALKMARIRQLDTILEEKLGNNLYSNVVPRKQKKAKSPSQSKDTASSSSNRTFVTQTQSIQPSTVSNGGETSRSSTSNKHSNDDEVSTGAKKSHNFIERNKQVVANGMKANMTKEEEERLEKLLRDETIDSPNEDNGRPEVTTPPQQCNEFTMTEEEKKAIEELIATNSSAYPLIGIDELQEGPVDEALRSTGGTSHPVKENIIQETKRERLQRQRLSRVEQELRLLHECPSVVIVGDDRDEDEHADCRSEISFATVASSTCSTRSGIISRHDFKCFLAQQKENYRSTPTASADDIRQLLLSINTGTSVPSNTVTATTV
ncbi:hypothetical protein PPTG_05643 [Phytophthora nicotianae INRA-310]|uniref:Fibrous sheath-interacting protein 1 n=1 Tax=Phytophthora nicotianae (strain INRA-310) TaxID=761204 RepID=W2R0G6_PHYN3|nr:hypothetical protein PPTG_05643 [Phytophthora nicotianae INRA-310]ETN18005.1 hypothetical protein PPTG_05643 [Phytophthora nicotianae INRA-310]